MGSRMPLSSYCCSDHYKNLLKMLQMTIRLLQVKALQVLYQKLIQIQVHQAYNQCFKNRTGLVGSTGPTVDWSVRPIQPLAGHRSGSL